ncbi:MAG: fibronectin type III domain-containing protein, partial [Thermoplasmata archaeon]
TGSGRYFHERGYDAPGSYTFWIFANDTMFNLASYLGTFNITDGTPPTISEVSSIPDPQEVFGRVNISAMVEDNYQLLDVAVSIADTGTFPMAFDPSSGRYFHERRYDVLGTFTFWIFANDSFSNQADCTGIFNITDSVPPTIEDLWKIPDPQEVSGFVNISADVSDNYLLSSASINIQAIGNFSMSYDSSFGRFYCNRSYQVLGVHSFTIWASDSNGNWNFLSERFEIVDSLPPQISHTPPASVTVGSEVKIQANVSDNYQVASVWLNYTDTAGVHFNVSMSQLGGDSYGLTIPAQIEVGEVVYHIWAMDEAGNGASTQLYQVSVLAGEDRTIPRPPQNLRVQKGSDGGSAELSWEEPTLNEDGSPIEDLEGYNIYRLELESGTEVKLNQLPLESASYTDYSVGSGKTYQYQVTAVDSSGHESNYSNPAVIFFAEEDSLLVWEVLTIVILVLVISLTLVLLLGRKKKEKVSEGEENDGSAAEEEHLSKEKSE